MHYRVEFALGSEALHLGLRRIVADGRGGGGCIPITRGLFVDTITRWLHQWYSSVGKVFKRGVAKRRRWLGNEHSDIRWQLRRHHCGRRDIPGAAMSTDVSDRHDEATNRSKACASTSAL